MAISMVEEYDASGDVDAEIVALAERIATDGPWLPLAQPVVNEAAARAAARKAVADLVAMSISLHGSGTRRCSTFTRNAMGSMQRSDDQPCNARSDAAG